jgi:hypothetical protein
VRWLRRVREMEELRETRGQEMERKQAEKRRGS